jgi:hypothetical protein
MVHVITSDLDIYHTEPGVLYYQLVHNTRWYPDNVPLFLCKRSLTWGKLLIICPIEVLVTAVFWEGAAIVDVSTYHYLSYIHDLLKY